VEGITCIGAWSHINSAIYRRHKLSPILSVRTHCSKGRTLLAESCYLVVVVDTAKNDQVVAMLIKTGLNNALLPTLFTVVNNIEQYC
jgi:diaminopimelate decarboxylase